MEFLQIAVMAFAFGMFYNFPMGPVGIICLRRGIHHGTAAGFVSGLGTSTVDAFYALLACVSAAWVQWFVQQYESWIQLIGGTIVLAIGMSILQSRKLPSKEDLSSDDIGDDISYGGMFLSIAGLGLTNPAGVLGIIGFLTLIGFAEHGTRTDLTVAFVASFFLGSIAIWGITSTFAGWQRSRLSPWHLRWLNRLSGTGISCFGGWLLANGVIAKL